MRDLGTLLAAAAPFHRLALPLAAAACLSLTACPPPAYTLRMRSTLAPVDTSSVSPKLKGKQYDKIMIMPPSGTVRGEFDTTIALFEKEFIKKGLTPINGAITGRVVAEMEVGDKGNRKQEGASGLSDVERALIMAKETGADAVLQIGQFGWSQAPVATRYFILENPAAGGEYKEVTLEQYQGFTGQKKEFRSPWFTFIGRLTDVQSGQVMASFKVEAASNWNLSADYVAQYTGDALVAENFVYARSWYDMSSGGYNAEAGEWLKPASERTVEKVIAEVANNILIR